MPMFERLQKPFLTVETGEAYQPIRLYYKIREADQLIQSLSQLKCCKLTSNQTWSWFWQDECNDLQFESLESFKRNPERPIRLGTLSIRDHILYLNLASFKRACLAVPFFHRIISPSVSIIDHADFINKVFGLDERLPHGFSELFKEDELDHIVQQRMVDYEKIQEQCENAESPEEALKILSDYMDTETHKRLPYAERYVFQHEENPDPDIIFLGFYIFLRGRELVAIRRWFGNTGYTLADAADEAVEQVFGSMNIDIID